MQTTIKWHKESNRRTEPFSFWKTETRTFFGRFWKWIFYPFKLIKWRYFFSSKIKRRKSILLSLTCKIIEILRCKSNWNKPSKLDLFDRKNRTAKPNSYLLISALLSHYFIKKCAAQTIDIFYLVPFQSSKSIEMSWFNEWLGREPL